MPDCPRPDTTVLASSSGIKPIMLRYTKLQITAGHKAGHVTHHDTAAIKACADVLNMR